VIYICSYHSTLVRACQ